MFGGSSIGEAFVVVRPDTSGFVGAARTGILGPLKGIAGVATAAFAGIGVARLVTDTIKAGATFDTTLRQMAQVAKVPQAELGTLSDLALQMGKDTVFSAQEAAQAMLELAKGGMSAAAIQAGGLKATLTLAAAGGIELGEAAKFVSNGLNQFKLKAKQAGRVAAALAGGANASTASIDSLGAGLEQVGLVAGSFGLSINDTVGTLAAFAQNALRGSDAGTSLKTMLIAIGNPTNKAKQAMADLGLKFTDAEGHFKGITDIAEQLRLKLGPLSEATRNQALSTIFGNDAQRAGIALINEGGKGVAKYIKATKDRGAAEDLARARTEGAAGALERLKGAFETVQIQVSQRFLPAIAAGADKLAGLLTDAFDGIDGAVKRLDLGGVSDKLTSQAKGWATAIIGGFKTGLEKGDWSQLGSILGRGLGQAIGNGANLIGQAFAGVQWIDVGKQVGKDAAPFVIGFVNEFTGSLLLEAKNHPLDFALFVASIIPVGRAAGLLTKVFGKIPILGPILRSLSGAGKLLERPVFGIIRSIARFFGLAIERAFPGIGERIGKWSLRWILGIAAKYGAMRNAGRRFIRGLVDGVLSQAGLVIRNVAQVVGWVLRPFRGAGRWLLGAGRAIIGGLVSGLRSALGRIGGPLGGIASRVRGAVAGAASWLFSAGQAVVGGLISGIQSRIPGLGGVLGGIKGFIQSHKGPLDADRKLLIPAGRAVMSGLMTGISAETGNLRRTLRDVTGLLGVDGAALSTSRRAGTTTPATTAASAPAGVTQHFTLVQQPGQSAPAFVQAAMFAARTQLRPAG